MHVAPLRIAEPSDLVAFGRSMSVPEMPAASGLAAEASVMALESVVSMVLPWRLAALPEFQSQETESQHRRQTYFPSLPGLTG